MGKVNKKYPSNSSLSSTGIRSPKLVSTKQEIDHEFSEELSDGGERNEIIKRQQNN